MTIKLTIKHYFCTVNEQISNLFDKGVGIVTMATRHTFLTDGHEMNMTSQPFMPQALNVVLRFPLLHLKAELRKLHGLYEPGTHQQG